MTRLPEANAPHYGKVFNEIAAEYDRRRPAYPDELIDQACRVAGIGSGDHVLEVGCGSGQLTRGLLARGLRVTALEPGASLIALARQNLAGAGEVEFVNAQFEDAPLPREHFAAVFSASAFHWVDPAVSWRKAAEVLVRRGTLALVQYFGLQEPGSQADQEAVLAAMRKIAPDVAAHWPAYRDLDGTLAGMEQRRGNVSRVWAWLGSYDLGQDYAGRLFGDVQVAVMPKLLEHTPDELNALVRTMSFYARFSAAQRAALEREYEAITPGSGARFALAPSRLSSRPGARCSNISGPVEKQPVRRSGLAACFPTSKTPASGAASFFSQAGGRQMSEVSYPLDPAGRRVIDVLLVDDDPGDVLMTREAFELSPGPSMLHVVGDGEQAMRFLRRTGEFTAAPRPSLILLDLNLPRRNGLEVLADLKADPGLLTIPVVIVTTSQAETDILTSYRLHANAYITKPVTFDRFTEAIRQVDDFFLTLAQLPD